MYRRTDSKLLKSLVYQRDREIPSFTMKLTVESFVGLLKNESSNIIDQSVEF